MSEDSIYYAELSIGAEFLAERATDPAERAAHLRMADLYGRRALEAAEADGRSIH